MHTLPGRAHATASVRTARQRGLSRGTRAYGTRLADPDVPPKLDRIMRYGIYLFLIMAMLVPAGRWGVAAQAPIARAAISGGVGLAEGVVVSLAILVARAEFEEEYVESISDVVSVPLFVAPVVGVTFGLAGRDAFASSMIGSAAGMAIGATAGGLIGRFTSDDPESSWAGAIIGAGAGLTVGRLLLGILEWHDDGGSGRPSMSIGFRIPQ